MHDFPKAMYRPGSTMRVWNAHDVDYRVVADADEEAAATADGWFQHPSCRRDPPEPTDEEQGAVAGVIALAAASLPSHPLDHDGDGRKGGSLPRQRKSKAPA